jgi:hypothetical protein
MAGHLRVWISMDTSGAALARGSRSRDASSPHALFKSAFEAPGSAAALVRPLVPAAIRDAICWDTMTSERGSFVDAVLAEHHGDLVFSARLRGSTRAACSCCSSTRARRTRR